MAQSDVRRIFGAAPGRYGVGLGARLAEGDWLTRDELAETYLAATSHAYGASADGEEASAAFAASVASADALLHCARLCTRDPANG